MSKIDDLTRLKHIWVICPPPEADTESPLFFVEVQFSGESDFYSRFFAEIFLYLRQYQPIWSLVIGHLSFVFYPKSLMTND